MKVKIFSIGLGGLEEEINAWLSANPDVSVEHVKVVQELGSVQRLIVLIFYRGDLGKSEPLFPELGRD